ncbi:hypothetical protein ABEB36_014555 [Hypothenemus hampei]|uniref:MADF domain-containing protein n=1 Tax=Hypothenemus hampei TaxID=57062 RepID=A0ABD1E6T1_HYPHA
MDNEKLIALVKENSVLYDLKHPKYLNAQFKDRIWNNIGEKLQMSGAICKARWSNIRDNYRKSKKRRMIKSGQAAIKAKKYKFEEQLGFLVPYMEERTTYSNVVENDSQTLPVHNCTDDDQNLLIEDNNEANVEINMYEDTVNSSNYDTTEIPISIDKTQKIIHYQIKNKPNTNTESASSVLMKFILQKNEGPSPPEQIHVVDAFLSALAPTLKSFSPYYLNIVKSKIFSIVQEAELDILTQKIITPLSSSTSTSNTP